MQLDLFGQAKVEVEKPEPVTIVRLGKREAQVPLRKQRRAALSRLEIVTDLEGKDVYIDSYDAGGRHFWFNNLKLPRLQLEFYPRRFKDSFVVVEKVRSDSLGCWFSAPAKRQAVTVFW